MPRKTVWQAAAILATIALAIFALLSAKSAAVKALDSLGYKLVSWRGMDVFDGLAIVAVGLLLFSTTLFATDLFRRILNIKIKLGDEYISCRKCKENDIATVLELAYKSFGERATREDQIYDLFKYTPESFWLVEGAKAYGYFIVYSLTEDGERAIVGGYYHGANPAREHIYRSAKKSEAVCIGAVVGTGTRGKAAALAALTTYIQSAGAKRIYGKAVSSDGLRLVERFEFKRVDGRPQYESDHYYCSVPVPARLSAID